MRRTPKALHLLLAATGAIIATAATAATSESPADQIIARVAVPSPERRVGEVRLIRRGDAAVVQTLLYTKVLRRVVGEIRNKELANWPAEREGHADAMRYVEALADVQQQIWSRQPVRARGADRRQRMLIELVLDESTAQVVLGTYQADEQGDSPRVTAREPLVVLDLARDYIAANMRLIAADSFGLSGAALDELLAPLSLPQIEMRRPGPLEARIISGIMLNITRDMMSAIAVSAEDERRIVRLGKRLGVRSKAGVVRLAVDELERRVEREQLGKAIRAYVEQYGRLDLDENLQLSAGGVARDET